MRNGISAIAVAIFGALAVVGLASRAFAECKLLELGELPLKVEEGRMLLDGSINGQPVRLMIDTGSPENMIFRTAAGRLGLPLNELQGVHMYGVGGEMRLQTTRVKTLTLGALVSHNEIMFAGNDHPDQDPNIVGLIGRRFLAQADIEFDVAGGKLRFLKSSGCADGQMAYWARSSYSQADLEGATDPESEISGRAHLNGVPVGVTFDTGSSRSVVTLAGAGAAGVRPGGEGVVQVGEIVGVGPRPIPIYVGTFKTFSLGDETIGNAKLRISDLYVFNKMSETGSIVPVEVGADSKMIIGLDFFKSHHVLISQSRRKMYFTYSGGPVFDTRAEGDAPPAAPPAR